MSIKRVVFAIVFSCITIQMWAQPDVAPDDPASDPDVVPITGIEYLLIGGGAYGISRLLKNRNKKNNKI